MTARKTYAVALAILFLVEGILGLFSPVVFGVLTTNTLHSLIHIVLGIVGIMAARSGHSGDYLLFVGLLLLAVGLLWFVPGFSDVITRVLNVNRAVALLNVVIGVLSLFMTCNPKTRVQSRSHTSL
jgi:uncharacterized membrane protein